MSMTTKLALYASVFGLFAGTALADNMITVSAAESTVQPKVIMYSSGGVGEESQELFEKISNNSNKPFFIMTSLLSTYTTF